MPTMTADQRRQEAKASYDAFLAACPSRDLLARLSDKWVGLVLSALHEERELRFSELARRIAGVSQKMLTQTLRHLERDGLVARTVTPTVPVTVSYRTTPLGDSLAVVVLGVKTWAEAHMGEVAQAREAFDRGNTAPSA